MKRRYKVLPMPLWATIGLQKSIIAASKFAECVQNCERIEPVFKRNGFYLDRQTGQTWIEREGEAWVYDTRQSFQYELDHNDGNNRMETRIFDAIKVLNEAGLASESQKKLFQIEVTRRNFQRHRIYGLKAMMRFRLFKKRLMESKSVAENKSGNIIEQTTHE